MNVIKRFVPFAFLCILLHPSLVSAQNTSRDSRVQPDKLMDSIGVKEGMIIGEGGAGWGYFTFKLAERVGPKGHIYANDIDQNALEGIERRSQQEEISNITTILGEVDDPLFPEQKLDMVFMIAAFHDFEKPTAWLRNVKSSLKPGATLVIVEKKIRGIKERIEKGAAEAGFEIVRKETFLPEDTIYILKMKTSFIEPKIESFL